MKTQATDIAALAIVGSEDNAVIAYGSVQLPFPISDTGDMVEIDAAFLTGIKVRNGKVVTSGTVKLKHINVCLKEAGMEVTDPNKAWFNKNVRDGYHKFLRHYNRVLIREGTAVSASCSIRTAKKTGQRTLTGKVGYEVDLTPKTTVDVEKAKAAKSKKNSERRARRDAKKKGLVSLKSAMETVTMPAVPA